MAVGFKRIACFGGGLITLGVLGAAHASNSWDLRRPPGHFGALGSGLYGFCFRVRLLGAITGGFDMVSMEMVFALVSEVRLVWRFSA